MRKPKKFKLLIEITDEPPLGVPYISHREILATLNKLDLKMAFVDFKIVKEL